MTWIETVSGKRFDYMNVRPEDICLKDIAISLSNQCRFLGHTGQFYSVLEHSLWVHHHARKLGLPSTVKKAALLHDAQEAYVGDIPSPLKMWMRTQRGGDAYDRMETLIQSTIFTKYIGVSIEMIPATLVRVNQIDKCMLLAEKRDILQNTTDWELGEYIPFQEAMDNRFGEREDMIDLFLTLCEQLGIHD